MSKKTTETELMPTKQVVAIAVGITAAATVMSFGIMYRGPILSFAKAQVARAKDFMPKRSEDTPS